MPRRLGRVKGSGCCRLASVGCRAGRRAGRPGGPMECCRPVPSRGEHRISPRRLSRPQQVRRQSLHPPGFGSARRFDPRRVRGEQVAGVDPWSCAVLGAAPGRSAHPAGVGSVRGRILSSMVRRGARRRARVGWRRLRVQRLVRSPSRIRSRRDSCCWRLSCSGARCSSCRSWSPSGPCCGSSRLLGWAFRCRSPTSSRWSTS